MIFDLASFEPIGCDLAVGADGSVTVTTTAEFSAIVTSDQSAMNAFSTGGYLVLEVENQMETNVALAAHFWRKAVAPSPADPEGARPDMLFTFGTFPHLPTRLALDLQKLDGQQLFLDRTPGKLKSMAFGAGMGADEVRQFGLGIIRSEPGARLLIRSAGVEAEEPEYPLPDLTLVDEIGQWATREWPGKTAGIDALSSYLRSETDAALAARAAGESAANDPERSRWGGFIGLASNSTPTFEGTGYFRADHTGTRHVLVDPDGNPFYSIGLDCVEETIDARVDGIQKLFSWLPPREGPLSDLWRSGSSRFPDAKSVDFLGANLRRALGSEWFERWAALTEERLGRWRFNTIGNWSTRRFIEYSQMPYVVPLRGEITTADPIFRDFPDVFSPEYRAASDRHAEQLAAFEGDKRLLGYFIMNEPHWAFVKDLNVAEKLLANPADLASKDELIKFLSGRYAGEPAKLASAWGLEKKLSTFDDLRRPIENACSLSNAAARDLDDFNTILIRKFAEEPCAAAKRADPHHLNMGMRYAFVSQPALYETGEFFDVFSINRYAPTALPEVEEIGRRTDKPVLIGEFHHGALDAGLPANGIRGVRTQAERAEAYRHFVETTASSQYSVGVHYFTLNDQAILGRFDGENFQIGIVDICQRPYDAFASGIRETNTALAEVIFGEREPADYYPEEATVGF